MNLVMEIGKVVAERVPLSYEGLQSSLERERYQQRVARELCIKHEKLLQRHGITPVFYVEGVRSKANDIIPFIKVKVNC